MNKSIRNLISIIILIILTTVSGCNFESNNNIKSDKNLENNSISEDKKAGEIEKDDNLLLNENKAATFKEQQQTRYCDTQVHFLNVGQADCILIVSNNQYMIVDGGNNDDADYIISYLKELGVKRLEYVIGTHPHEDHIGSLDAIISNFDIGKVIMPQVVHTTRTFEDVLDAIDDKGLKLTKPIVGDSYQIGNGEFQIIAPNNDYDDDFNNWSVGIRLVSGKTSFIMCGDAETDAETDIINNGLELKADVIKLGHHGSNTSSSKDFLDAVDFRYAVISCGKGNSYGHPHIEVLNELKNRDTKLFRTDIQGTIIAESDGNTISWNMEPTNNYEGGIDDEDIINVDNYENDDTQVNVKPDQNKKNNENNKTNDIIYILNTNTKKFHYKDCSSVSRMSEKNKKETNESREVIIYNGYDPCKTCNP